MQIFLLVQQDRNNDNNMKIRVWTVLWTIIRKTRNHCQDVDKRGDEDHCQDRDHCQNGNEYSDR